MEREKELVDELVSSTRKMRSLDLEPLQIEIIRELVDGKRTLAELAETFYGVRRSNGSFTAHYSKLRRAMADLEKTGFAVSVGLFGRGKPYRLTHYGVARIASISPGVKRPDLLSHIDMLFYALAPVTASLCLFLSATGGPPFLASLASFFFTLGITVTRSIQILRKVT